MDEEVMARFDVGGLPPSDREELRGLLGRYDVAAEFVGADLLAPAAETELVEDLLLHLTSGGEVGLPSARGRAADRHDLFHDGLAPVWRRVLGYLVPGYALLLVTWLASSVNATMAQALGWAGFVSGVVLVAVSAKTVGMWLFRIRIVHLVDGTPPGWRTAALRWAMVGWPALIAGGAHAIGLDPVADAASVVGIVWPLVCFGPIVADPLRQGLHDRVAGTLVVNDAYRPGAAWPVRSI